MSDFTEKVRAMLDACPVGKFFVLTDMGEEYRKMFNAAPTLLREACERIERFEELYEIVLWEKECEDFQRPPSRKFQTHLGHIPWLDAKKAKENWQSKGWRSLARIYGNSWLQKQDALSALDAKEQS